MNAFGIVLGAAYIAATIAFVGFHSVIFNVIMGIIAVEMILLVLA
jgi:hypothetical protein